MCLDVNCIQTAWDKEKR